MVAGSWWTFRISLEAVEKWASVYGAVMEYNGSDCTSMRKVTILLIIDDVWSVLYSSSTPCG